MSRGVLPHSTVHCPHLRPVASVRVNVEDWSDSTVTVMLAGLGKIEK